MADILIRGMEMPKENEILVFDEWHGEIYARSTANLGTKSYEVVPLPAGHGRLIDADELLSVLDILASKGGGNYVWDQMKNIVEAMVTIVPAEGGGE